jgi:hypothetical protein
MAKIISIIDLVQGVRAQASIEVLDTVYDSLLRSAGILGVDFEKLSDDATKILGALEVIINLNNEMAVNAIPENLVSFQLEPYFIEVQDEHILPDEEDEEDIAECKCSSCEFDGICPHSSK